MDQNENWASGNDVGDNRDNDGAAEPQENAGDSISVDGDDGAGDQESGDMVLSEYEIIRRDNMA